MFLRKLAVAHRRSLLQQLIFFVNINKNPPVSIYGFVFLRSEGLYLWFTLETLFSHSLYSLRNPLTPIPDVFHPYSWRRGVAFRREMPDVGRCEPGARLLFLDLTLHNLRKAFNDKHIEGLVHFSRPPTLVAEMKHSQSWTPDYWSNGVTRAGKGAARIEV